MESYALDDSQRHLEQQGELSLSSPQFSDGELMTNSVTMFIVFSYGLRALKFWREGLEDRS